VTDTELAGSSAKMLSSPMRMNDAKLANVDDTELPDEDGEGLDRDSDIGDSADIGKEDVTVVGEEDVADLGDEKILGFPGLTEGCRILSLRERMINVYQL